MESKGWRILKTVKLSYFCDAPQFSWLFLPLSGPALLSPARLGNDESFLPPRRQTCWAQRSPPGVGTKWSKLISIRWSFRGAESSINGFRDTVQCTLIQILIFCAKRSIEKHNFEGIWAQNQKEMWFLKVWIYQQFWLIGISVHRVWKKFGYVPVDRCPPRRGLGT